VAAVWLGKHNNQPKVGVFCGEDIGKGGRPRWNVLGRVFAVVWGRRIRRQKKQKNKIRRGLDGRRLAKKHTTTNQKQAAATEGTMEGRRDEREAWGSAISLFFGGGEV